MDQRSKNSGAPHDYDRRPGTVNLGKEFETNITALVALRCIALEDTEDMWMGSNIAQFEDFDDIVLYRRTTQGRRLIYMLQLKHQENPKNIAKSEFEKDSGDFSLFKYCKSLNLLKEKLVCNASNEHEVIQYLRDVDDRVFVLYTNKGVDEFDFLEKHYDHTLDFLDTSSSKQNRFKFNSEFPEKVILFSNQIHVNDAIHLTEEEIKHLLGSSFNLSAMTSNKVVIKFLDFIRTWEKGTKINKSQKYFTLTKSDVINKLTDILLSPYRYKFSNESFGNGQEKPVWNKIVQDKNITIVDSDESVGAFLNQYVVGEVRKHLRGFEKSWIEKLTKKTLQLIRKKDEDLVMNLLKMNGNPENITILDLYASVWFTNRIPLLLKVTAVKEYENILKILKLSNYRPHVIIVKSPTFKLKSKIVATSNYFMTLDDLNDEDRGTMLNQPVKFQNRPNHTLENLIDKSMYKFVTCKDVIQILQGNFNVGNEYEPLTDFHIERTLSRVFLKPAVLNDIKDEIFILKYVDRGGPGKKPAVEEYSFPNNVIVVEGSKTLDEDNWRGKVIHEVFRYGDDYLEWKKSFGTTRNILQYVSEQEEDLIGFVPGMGWISFDDAQNYFLHDTHIITAAPGMGKSTFADYMAVHVPTNIWVIKINLNKYQDYYKNIQNNSVLDQLKFFTDCLLQESKNLELSKAIFNKCLNAKQVLVILDGFDEIVIGYEKEVINIAKCLHDEGFPLWLTTRPNKKHELEEIFCSIALTLNPLTVYDQRKLFKKHFHRMCTSDNLHRETFQSVIETFVDTLMEVVRHNFNDSRGKFMEIPLHVKLLAEVFSADCQKSLQTGSIILKNTFHLVDLYEKFITRKIDILCEKFGNDAKTSRLMIEKYQKLFALTYLYHEDLLKNLKINEQLDVYYNGEEYKMHFLQREGIVVVEQKHNGKELLYNINFTHRTFAEYLAAQWFSENFSNADYKIRCSIRNLINYSIDLVGDMLNLMLSKDYPLHAAVLTENVDESKRILEAHPTSASQLDKGGRTILHIVAIKRNVNPQITNILQTIMNDNIRDTKDFICAFTVLDYANFYGHYALANQMCERFRNLTITSASFNLDNTQQFLEKCLKRNYKSLFEAGLRFQISRILLADSRGRSISLRCRLPYAFDSHYTSSLLENHISEFYMITISDFLQFKFKINDSPVGHYYYDLDIACAFGTEENVSYLLSEGANINSSTFDATPLHYAARHNRLENVQLLLDRRAKTDQLDEDGQTALHWATSADVVTELLSNGADIDKLDMNDNTPLNISLKNGNFDVAALLLLNDANCDIENCSGNSPLHYAAMKNCTDIVNELISKGACVNKQNKDGKIPLNIALDKNNLDVARLLLLKGANCHLENRVGYSSLHYAAQSNSPDIITALLSKGVCVNKQNEDGDTPLHIALKNKNLDIARLLLLQGANCYMQNYFGYSSVHYAAQSNYPDIVTQLLSKGVSINHQNNEGDTPLNVALSNENVDVARLLLLKGANCNLENASGNSCLHYAAQSDHPDIIIEVLSKGVCINQQNKDGDTPLNIALSKRNLDVARLLLLKGAKCNLENTSGCSSLHYASRSDCPDIITQILSKGVSINQQNKEGDTPLNIALSKRNLDVAKLLLLKGANCNLQNASGYSCLHYAAESDCPDIITEILSKGVCTNQQNKEGDTPLNIALSKRNLDVARLLLQKGANCNLENASGSSCLHYAAESDCPDIITEILSKGVGINKQNKEGDTPLHITLCNKNLDIARLLLLEGANCNLENTSGYSCLHYAAESNCPDIITELLSKGVSVNKHNRDGDTPLHVALRNKNLGIARLLLQQGANCNFENRSGNSCLHYASRSDCPDIITELLSKGVSINQQNKDGDTSLNIALSNRYLSIARLLLAKGANCNLENTSGNSCLHYAAESHCPDIITGILSKGVSFNKQNADGDTPLHIALRNGNLEIAKLLLKQGANSNLENTSGYSSLHYAAQSDCPDIITELLSKGVCVNQQNKEGDTPLNIALSKKNLEVARLLLSKGANCVENTSGYSSLHYAAQSNCPDIITELLSKDACVNKQDKDGYTPLHIALENNNLDVARLLLLRGADSNFESNGGYTALHYASKSDCPDIITELLSKGVCVNKQHKDGYTALHIALDNKNLNVARLLLLKGADCNLENIDGFSLLHYASKSNCPDIITELLSKGVCVNKQRKDGSTALHIALDNKNLDVARLLLLKDADCNLENSCGYTSLHYASKINCPDIINELLSKGLSVNKQHKDGDTALHIALDNKNLDVARLLLLKGADCNLENSCGYTSLHYASKINCPDIINELLSKGLSVNKQHKDGDTALHIALDNKNVDVAKLLLLKGADCNLANILGWSPLHYAARSNFPDIISELLSKGVCINKQNENDDTPLNIALRHGNLDVARLLLLEGANSNLENHSGKSSLHYAARNSCDDIINKLLSQGVCINKKDKDGDTPLHIAVKHSRIDTVEFLLESGADVNAENHYGQSPLHVAVTAGKKTPGKKPRKKNPH